MLTLFALVSCGGESDEGMNEPEKSQDERLNDRLDGDWDVESLRVDGDEAIGDYVQKMTIEFEAKTSTGGKSTWELFDNDGALTTIEGSYTVQNDGEEISFEGDELEINVSGDNMDLEGNVGGSYWIIKAEKD